MKTKSKRPPGRPWRLLTLKEKAERFQRRGDLRKAHKILKYDCELCGGKVTPGDKYMDFVSCSVLRNGHLDCIEDCIGFDTDAKPEPKKPSKAEVEKDRLITPKVPWEVFDLNDHKGIETGRSSCKDPNLISIPSRGTVKTGNLFNGDYPQLDTSGIGRPMPRGPETITLIVDPNMAQVYRQLNGNVILSVKNGQVTAVSVSAGVATPVAVKTVTPKVVSPPKPKNPALRFLDWLSGL